MVAHINESGERQSIKEHLQGTAKIAESFAQEFGCGEMGYFCAMLHDIGKYSEAFQKRIEDPEHVKKVDHSTAGALEAMGQGNVPAAMAIAGHHSGLMDGGSFKLAQEGDGTFFGRLKNRFRIMAIGKRISYGPMQKYLPFVWKGITKNLPCRFLFECYIPVWWMRITWIRKGLWEEMELKEAAIPRLMSCASGLISISVNG